MYSIICAVDLAPLINKSANFMFENFSFINQYELFINSNALFVNYTNFHKMTFVTCIIILRLVIVITLHI